MTYHIHTESFPNLPAIAGQYFPGFTIETAQGYWEGQPEPSTIIEIVTDDARKVDRLAEAIRLANGQTAVLVEAYESSDHLVTAPQ